MPMPPETLRGLPNVGMKRGRGEGRPRIAEIRLKLLFAPEHDENSPRERQRRFVVPLVIRTWLGVGAPFRPDPIGVCSTIGSAAMISSFW